MDGFSYPKSNTTNQTPTAVTMGSLVSTVLQVKNQLDFIDQFLSIYVPEYLQLKNYAIETQQVGMAPVVPPTASFQAPVPPSARFQDPASVPMYTSSIIHSVPGNQMVSNNMMRNGNFYVVPPEKPKGRRKSPVVKKNPTVNVATPATLKRRGRKRKYPLANPIETAVPLHGCQNRHIHQAPPQAPEGVIKIYIPPPTHINSSGDATTPRTQTGSSGHPGTNSKNMMSSLDILAAVSYVMKQRDVGSHVSQDMSVNSLNSTACVPNVIQQNLHAGGTSSSDVPTHLQNASTSNNQEEDSSQFDKFANPNVPSSRVPEGQEESRQSESELHHQPYASGEILVHNLTPESPLSPMSQQNLTQSQEEYNSINATTPEREITV